MFIDIVGCTASFSKLKPAVVSDQTVFRINIAKSGGCKKWKPDSKTSETERTISVIFLRLFRANACFISYIRTFMVLLPSPVFDLPSPPLSNPMVYFYLYRVASSTPQTIFPSSSR
jgi:hypothetical protein